MVGECWRVCNGRLRWELWCVRVGVDLFPIHRWLHTRESNERGIQNRGNGALVMIRLDMAYSLLAECPQTASKDGERWINS